MTQIVLVTAMAKDHIQERWGEEVRRLSEYVQIGDWINTLVAQREAWDTGGQALEQAKLQFFANDYLSFPAAPHSFQHKAPAVQATYRPYFWARFRRCGPSPRPTPPDGPEACCIPRPIRDRRRTAPG